MKECFGVIIHKSLEKNNTYIVCFGHKCIAVFNFETWNPASFIIVDSQ